MFVLNAWEKISSYKKVEDKKILKLGGLGASHEQKFVFWDNILQNISWQVKQLSKIGQDQNSLTSFFE